MIVFVVIGDYIGVFWVVGRIIGLFIICIVIFIVVRYVWVFKNNINVKRYYYL